MKINIETEVLLHEPRFLPQSLEKKESKILRKICSDNHISLKAILTMTLSTLVFGKIYNKSDCLMATLKWKISCLIKRVIINGIHIELFWSSYSLWVTNQNLAKCYAYGYVSKTRVS